MKQEFWPDGGKAHGSKNFDQKRTRPRCLLVTCGRVLKDDHKDAIKDNQRDQPSCNDAHIEIVQKSSSELDASVTKGTEIRQKRHAEFVVVSNTEVLIKLAVNRLNGFYAPRLHEAAPKAEFSSADRVYVSTWRAATTTAAQGALVQLKCEHRDAEPLRAEAKKVLASAGDV